VGVLGVLTYEPTGLEFRNEGREFGINSFRRGLETILTEGIDFELLLESFLNPLFQIQGCN
jgi:hypothetical protein